MAVRVTFRFLLFLLSLGLSFSLGWANPLNPSTVPAAAVPASVPTPIPGPVSTPASPLAVSPNFTQPVLNMPAGTVIQPLCSSPLDPLCLHEWSQMAEPMAVYPTAEGQMPEFQYFLPAFLPSQISSEDPSNSENWERLRFSSSYRSRGGRSSSRRSRRGGGIYRPPSRQQKSAPSSEKKVTYYQSETDPNRIRIVEEDSDGKRTVRETDKRLSSQEDVEKAPIVSVSSEDLEGWKPFSPVFSSSEEPSEEEATSDGQPERELYRHKSDPERVISVSRDADGQSQTVEGRIAYVSEEDIARASPTPQPPAEAGRGTGTGTRTGDQTGDQTEGAGNRESPTGGSRSARQRSEEEAPIPSSSEKEGSLPLEYQTSAPIQALPAVLGVEEAKDGCFLVEGKNFGGAEAKTEADFCPECRKESARSGVLSALLDNNGILNRLKSLLSSVDSKAKTRADGKVRGAIDSVEKICSPESSLSLIIGNFEKSCKMKFNDFFKSVYCKSCGSGVPPELMLAMMSIESAGECSAENTNGEHSLGLFQVEATKHSCKGKSYRANLKCLKNPLNNLEKGLDIFSDYYEKINGRKPSSSDKCQFWTDRTTKERDWHRKALSAYNGGPGWVRRAIRSAREEKTLRNTGYLQGYHKEIDNQYVGDSASWEDLRLFYFVEKLSPGNFSGSGRQQDKTVSNLAHVEAVLGRDVPGARPSLVDIWSQYTRNLLKRSPVSCPRAEGRQACLSAPASNLFLIPL